MFFKNRVSVLLICVVFCCCYGQVPRPIEENDNKSLHNGLSENIGNFSLELLYHTATSQPQDSNMIMSPFMVWTVLAVIAEGATGKTKYEISRALILPKDVDSTRRDFGAIANYLRVNPSTAELEKFNGIFVDRLSLIWQDFRETAKRSYDTDMVALNFTDYETTANVVNTAISLFTHGRVEKIVDSAYFKKEGILILTSALYFKGQWTVPFNKSFTLKQPFYDSNGKQIGEVNMMYNRYTYPFSNIKKLQARAIELPYGKEDRLSMIIMLPYPGVSLQAMFLNFQNLSLDWFFEELRISKEEYADDEVDCFLPRFKIESDINLTEVLRSKMGINDLFDMYNALLPYLARTPLYVSKAVHKAEIEVTEDGTTTPAVTVAQFSNRIGVVRFEANRPFTYMIIEKVTNTIIFRWILSDAFTILKQ